VKVGPEGTSFTCASIPTLVFALSRRSANPEREMRGALPIGPKEGDPSLRRSQRTCGSDRVPQERSDETTSH
jgi:hypothetical protein